MHYKIDLGENSMVEINWEEYKEYKLHSNKEDKFDILLDFIKSYYNMTNPSDIYQILAGDSLAQMMLEKHNIDDDETMENYLFREKQ